MAKHITLGSILAGQSLSAIFNLTSADPALIIMPSGWNGPNTRLTFQVSYDGVIFGDLYDKNGQEVRYPVIPNSFVRLEGGFRGMNYVKLRSGSSLSPMIQTAQRDFSIVTED